MEGNRVRREPFPHLIPQSRFDPMSKIYLGFYPNRTGPPCPARAMTRNYIGSTSNPYSNDRWTGRLDQNWNSSHVTHVTVTRFDDQSAGTRWDQPFAAGRDVLLDGPHLRPGAHLHVDADTILSLRGAPCAACSSRIPG